MYIAKLKEKIEEENNLNNDYKKESNEEKNILKV